MPRPEAPPMVVNRRLAAVVFADVAGYSRLMELDEIGTHERLQAILQELILPAIAGRGGRVVHTAGDGMLLEFPSTTAALRWAVDVQRAMRRRNAGVPRGSRIEFRIGINPGDVIVDGTDIVGDDVNVASRLETLAEPGGICVAAAVRQQVHEDLGIAFVDAGEQRVKNLAKPVQVFRVVDRGAALPKIYPGPAAARSPRRRRVAMFGGAAVLLVAIGFGIGPFDKPSAPEVPRPRSIVVAPFGAPAGDRQLTGLAATLEADVSRALANSLRSTTIVGPESGEESRQARDERARARLAHVRYVLTADVAEDADDVVVTARLSDGVTGQQLGSERRAISRYREREDRALLVSRVTAAARLLFQTAEARRVAADPAGATDPQSMVTRADLLFIGEDRNGTIAAERASMLAARRLYEEARERDPTLVAAWTGHVHTLNWEYWNDFTAGRNEALLAEMDRYSRKAIALDERDPAAWFARSAALGAQRQWKAAFEANERAIALDPTRPRLGLNRTFLYYMTGRPLEALQEIGRSLARGEDDSEYLYFACHSHIHLGEYQDALDKCGRAVAGNNTYWVHFDLAVAYAQTGDLERARAAAAELLRRVPDFTIARFETKAFSDNPVWAEQVRTRFIPGLRAAGVPER